MKLYLNPFNKDDACYANARRYHAFWLRVVARCKYDEIAARLGVTRERARQIVWRGGNDQKRLWRNAGYSRRAISHILAVQMRLSGQNDYEDLLDWQVSALP